MMYHKDNLDYSFLIHEKYQVTRTVWNAKFKKWVNVFCSLIMKIGELNNIILMILTIRFVRVAIFFWIANSCINV